MAFENSGMGLLSIFMGGLTGLSKFLGNIWKALTSQSAKNVGVLKSLNSQSSVSDINRITEIFESYKEKVGEESVKIEQAVYEEVEYFMEELYQVIQENDGILEKYQIRTKGVERRIDKIVSKIRGSIDRRVSRTVSLDNPECKRILLLPPGERKELAMNDFFQKALKEALEQVCSDIQEIIEDIFEELEEELPGAVAQSQKEAERWKNELERINTDNYRKETEKMIEEAEGVLAGCQLVMKLMEG